MNWIRVNSLKNFIWILNSEMQLVAHFQAFVTVPAVLISRCLGNNIGHLVLYELKLNAVTCYWTMSKNRIGYHWKGGSLIYYLCNDLFLIGKHWHHLTEEDSSHFIVLKSFGQAAGTCMFHLEELVFCHSIARRWSAFKNAFCFLHSGFYKVEF